MNAIEPDVAVRADGYLGYSDLRFVADSDGFQGGGSGSVSLTFDRIYIQGDVFGDAMDFEGGIEPKNVGPGLHLGWRDPDLGSAGVVGTYNHLDLGGGIADVYRAGVEGEFYLDQLTFGLNGGYIDFEGSGLGYVDGLVAFYPSERGRLNLRFGAFGIENSDPLIDIGVGGEYLVTAAMAPFLRWEASIPDTFGDVLQYSVVAGLAIYWGGDGPSLRDYDRNHFKPSCEGLLLFGRIC